MLVLHSHGEPGTGPAPSRRRSAEDLKRWSIMVRAGHAWAGSTFRQGGVAVRAAAEDTERLRGLFTQLVRRAPPHRAARTELGGQRGGQGRRDAFPGAL